MLNSTDFVHIYQIWCQQINSVMFLGHPSYWSSNSIPFRHENRSKLIEIEHANFRPIFDENRRFYRRFNGKTVESTVKPSNSTGPRFWENYQTKRYFSESLNKAWQERAVFNWFWSFSSNLGHASVHQGCHLASRNFALLCFALLLTEIWGVLESTLLCFALLFSGFFGMRKIPTLLCFALLCFRVSVDFVTLVIFGIFWENFEFFVSWSGNFG